MTFSNSFTSPVYITAIGLHGTPAKVVTTIEEVYTDQDSIDTYGRNPQNSSNQIEIENDVIQDADTAYSLAYSLVNDYKTPRRRYRAKAFAVPQLQIGDLVTVNIADTAESKTLFVVGYANKMSRSNMLEQELILEERLIAHYFTIGESAIGGDDQIAP